MRNRGLPAFLCDPPFLGGLVQSGFERPNIHRLREMKIEARAAAPLNVAIHTVAAEGDALTSRAQLAKFIHQFVAVAVGQSQIGKHQIVSERLRNIPRLFDGFCGGDFVTTAGQETGQRIASLIVVFHQQNST